MKWHLSCPRSETIAARIVHSNKQRRTTFLACNHSALGCRLRIGASPLPDYEPHRRPNNCRQSQWLLLLLTDFLQLCSPLLPGWCSPLVRIDVGSTILRKLTKPTSSHSKFVVDLHGDNNRSAKTHSIHDLFSPDHLVLGDIVPNSQDEVHTETRIIDQETNPGLELKACEVQLTVKYMKIELSGLCFWWGKRWHESCYRI